ncbi:OmpA family protein [candidate division KSB1 bacterium]|nr:OmpA family protein [candidate division KSB1 bacterium]
MNKRTKLIRTLIAVTLGIFLIGALLSSELVAQQDIKASLFKQADKALKEAKQVQADVLAPKNYSEAMEYYQDADKNFQKGKNLEDIRKKLSASVKYFNKAAEATRLAEVTLANSIKARSDAKEAGAPDFASTDWGKAEEKFLDASRKLEDGNVKAAKKKSGEAEPLFRKAELEAIKVNYLNETWELLKQADALAVKKYAPTTLVKAQDLIAKAEKELSENRYDTDVARSLAREAKYEAKHALYLSKIIEDLRDNKNLLEDYLLSTEIPLSQIAEKMDIVGSFEAGFDKTTNEIITYLIALQEKSEKLSQELSESNRQTEMLNARVSEMEEQLGGIEKEKSVLAKKIAAQAKIRQQFTTVEKMFNREEANVLRKVNDIIIRLIGLSFPVGKSTIEPQNFGLLTKVQKAINMFPECAITIEGHTDSHGSDEKNMILSQERAYAVSQYILANMGIDSSRMNAVGYGENKPIASNETKDGRAKNRRIDIVIHPKL